MATAPPVPPVISELPSPTSFRQTSAWLADADWSAVPPRPQIIAGPCSAESHDQLLDTARQLYQHGIRTLRMGIWKPRSRPNAFEGAGATGVEWMDWVRALKAELPDMRLTTEVATPAHVEQALQAGFDLVWIGARTTVSPFAVQELAEALAGTHLPVMVKNPVNPDLTLWIGAIERIRRAGITDVAACHRGFTYYGTGRYRNAPQWDIPMELRRLHPDLPMIGDPSHIAGERALVREVAQQALDLGFDGLIIESHRDPSCAKSDAAQQLTPDALAELLQTLTYRRPTSADEAYQRELHALRARVDEMDRDLLALIARRLDVVAEIGELKRENGVQFFQLNRFREVFRTRISQGEALGLREEFIAACLRLLHLEAIARQQASEGGDVLGS